MLKNHMAFLDKDLIYELKRNPSYTSPFPTDLLLVGLLQPWSSSVSQSPQDQPGAAWSENCCSYGRNRLFYCLK